MSTYLDYTDPVYFPNKFIPFGNTLDPASLTINGIPIFQIDISGVSRVIKLKYNFSWQDIDDISISNLTFYNYIELQPNDVFDGDKHYINSSFIDEDNELKFNHYGIFGINIHVTRNTRPIIKNLIIEGNVPFMGGGFVRPYSNNFIVQDCGHNGNIETGGGGICGAFCGHPYVRRVNTTLGGHRTDAYTLYTDKSEIDIHGCYSNGDIENGNRSVYYTIPRNIESFTLPEIVRNLLTIEGWIKLGEDLLIGVFTRKFFQSNYTNSLDRELMFYNDLNRTILYGGGGIVGYGCGDNTIYNRVTYDNPSVTKSEHDKYIPAAFKTIFTITECIHYGEVGYGCGGIVGAKFGSSEVLLPTTYDVTVNGVNEKRTRLYSKLEANAQKSTSEISTINFRPELNINYSYVLGDLREDSGGICGALCGRISDVNIENCYHYGEALADPGYNQTYDKDPAGSPMRSFPIERLSRKILKRTLKSSRTLAEKYSDSLLYKISKKLGTRTLEGPSLIGRTESNRI